MLINDQSDLNYARRNSKKLDFVITAHLQLEYLAKNFNLNVRSGNELVDPTEYDYYSKRVMKNLIWVESALKVEHHAVDQLIDAARGVMENAADPIVKLDVPLIVDAGQGAHWAEAH